eukprot:TRINITY_DN10568_c0_g1_i1.p1 TRINITY_DN10568_c0_g1~~TRINITY_DN10568_c0_g1_i1.p1  ORF type:complete len:107 (+),score=12.12 TRINITY_DN10568_c0_g1_i1:50-370(+)
MSVKIIVALEELQQIIKSTDDLILTYFFAHWCGPCAMIAPEIERMANEHQEVVFLKVDVEESRDIAKLYNIESIPSFLFIRSNYVVENLVTSKVEAMEDRLKELIS